MWASNGAAVQSRPYRKMESANFRRDGEYKIKPSAISKGKRIGQFNGISRHKKKIVELDRTMPASVKIRLEVLICMLRLGRIGEN